jgi:peptidoglycan/LPS O-acetylase OafA/YrhL
MCSPNTPSRARGRSGSAVDKGIGGWSVRTPCDSAQVIVVRPEGFFGTAQNDMPIVEPAAMRTSASFKRLGHQPSLDGVRAIAVLLVVAYHGFGSLGLFYGAGAVGVGLFFVLSGFLITALLVEEWQNSQRISLRSFYARRGLRIIPAFALLIVTFAIFTLAFTPNESKREALVVTVVSATYLTDIYQFALHRELVTGLSHTWTLSIEEQFYLIWPLALLLLLRRVSIDRVAVVGVAAGLLAALARWWLYDAGHTVHEFPLAWADSLLVGCVLGALSQYGRIPHLAGNPLWIAPAIGVLVVITAAGPEFDPTRYRVGFTLQALSGGVLIVGAVRDSGLLRRSLSLPPLVFVGRISYGLYLWHLPAMVLVWQLLPEVPRAIAAFGGIALGLSIAVLSYYVLERPLLRLKRRFARAESSTVAIA